MKKTILLTLAALLLVFGTWTLPDAPVYGAEVDRLLQTEADSPIQAVKYPGMQVYGGSNMPVLSDNTGADLETQADQALDALVQAYNKAETFCYGNEWLVLGLARGGAPVTAENYARYADSVAEALRKSGGVLDARKYTEYSRVILALTAAGCDAGDMAGYDLAEKLMDLEQVNWQGINGTAFALIALDAYAAMDTSVPVSGAAAEGASITEQLIDTLLDKQLPGGGWALSGDDADADVTGMVLQALAPYTTQTDVNAAVERALAVLSAMQQPSGGFATYGTETSESDVQVIVALCRLGIDPATDPRFVKKSKSVIYDLMSYYIEGEGFAHIRGQGVNELATAQGLYSLAAWDRFRDKKASLYDMSDVVRAAAVSDAAGSAGSGTNQAEGSSSAAAGGVRIAVDGVTVIFTESTGAPFLDEASRTQVPLRVTMENYGAAVDWNPETRTASAEKDGVRVEVPVGASYIYVNGEKQMIDTAAQIKEGRTYLPIRAVVEALGGTVDWNPSAQTVIITR